MAAVEPQPMVAGPELARHQQNRQWEWPQGRSLGCLNLGQQRRIEGFEGPEIK